MIITIGVFVGVIGICATVMWSVLFKPLIGQDKYLSINLRNEIAGEIQTSHNSLTTLSTAAIVLTFSVMEIFSKSTIEGIPFIISTWIFFMLCVLFGMGVGISSYVESAVSKVMVNNFVSAEKKRSGAEELSTAEKESLTYSVKKQYQLLKIRFWLLYSQSVAFASGTIFLTVFAVLNTCKQI